MTYWQGWTDPNRVAQIEAGWSTMLNRREPMYQLLRSLSGEVRSVLDHGAGTGRDTGVFLSLGWAYTAADISPLMVESIRVKFPGVDARIDDVTESRLKSEGWDLVYSGAVICHLPLNRVPDALRELTRLACCYVLIYTPYTHNEATWTEEREGFIFTHFNRGELRRLLEVNAPVERWVESGDTVMALLRKRTF